MQYNKQIADIVKKYERLFDYYSIGPCQKCIIEDFAIEIITSCAQTANDAIVGRVPVSEIPELIMKDFGV